MLSDLFENKTKWQSNTEAYSKL